MKKILLSAAAVMAMSSIAMAGGDIAPVVEEEVVVVEPVSTMTDSGFYLGLAYGLMDSTLDINGDIANTGASYSDNIIDDNFDEIMLQAGYKFNQYIAVEGRYWFGLDSTIDAVRSSVTGDSYDDLSVDAWGIYVKPMYPVTEAFNVYALLGYASAEYSETFYAPVNHGIDRVEVNSDALDGFSWGIGAEYSFTDNVSVFVDYVSIYDDSEVLPYTVNTMNNEFDYTIASWNFGVTYKF